jgi:MFS transporter, ACS family, hexuronate transporter
VVSRREAIRKTPVHAAATRPSFLNRNLWAFMSMYALGSMPLAFVLYNTSIYLSRAFQMSQTGIGALLWIPPLGWEVGYFFWGWHADRRGLRSAASIGEFRRSFLLLAVLSLPFALGAQVGSVAVLMTMLFFAMFV